MVDDVSHKEINNNIFNILLHNNKTQKIYTHILKIRRLEKFQLNNSVEINQIVSLTMYLHIYMHLEHPNHLTFVSLS